MANSAYVLIVVLLIFTIGISSCDSDDASENSIPTSFGGITLLNHSISSCKDNPDTSCTVSGNARNDAGFMFSTVTVRVSFLDEDGETVSTGIAVVDNLKRGREFDFAIESSSTNFKTDKYNIEIITKH